jgi:hypothetical protein
MGIAMKTLLVVSPLLLQSFVAPRRSHQMPCSIVPTLFGSTAITSAIP